MTLDSIGYDALNLGLNNQKLALVGLFCRAAREGHSVVLPKLSLFDPRNQEHPSVDFATVFDLTALQDFAAGFGIDLVRGPPALGVNGWNCFLMGGGCVGREAIKGLAGINEMVCQLFSHLVPLVIHTDTYRILSDVVFGRIGVKTVIQLRIEKDWIAYSENHLKENAQPGEDFLPSFPEILSKVKNTPEIPSRVAYVVCDEANLPVPKEVIRDEVLSRHGITLLWKSDVLSIPELSNFSILELALIDFEMAVRAPFFVGLSRSSFSDLALFEAFCRTRQTVTSHYIYNLPGNVLGKRTDNGSQIVPALVVNRLFAREPLIEAWDDDCRWPATLTAHISKFGDFTSESCVFPGLRGGALTCGVRGGAGEGLIEGFSVELSAGLPIDIEYRAMLDDGTWTPWVQRGGYVGTRGLGRQIRGYSARLFGPMAGRFRCICVGSFVGNRDVIVVSDGGVCCAPDRAQMEAMQLVFRPFTQYWTHAMGRGYSATLNGGDDTSLPRESGPLERRLSPSGSESEFNEAERPADIFAEIARFRQAES